eukprot:1161596-Pelagomonas_calceolata.AAC.12
MPPAQPQKCKTLLESWRSGRSDQEGDGKRGECGPFLTLLGQGKSRSILVGAGAYYHIRVFTGGQMWSQEGSSSHPTWSILDYDSLVHLQKPLKHWG